MPASFVAAARLGADFKNGFEMTPNVSDVKLCGLYDGRPANEVAEEPFPGLAGKVHPNATIAESGSPFVKPAHKTDSLFRQVVNDDVYIA